MSRRFETRLQGSGQYKEPTGECACCNKPATHWLRWAFTHMRGEDEFYGACQRHYTMAQDYAQHGRYFAHFRTKADFVARPEPGHTANRSG